MNRTETFTRLLAIPLAALALAGCGQAQTGAARPGTQPTDDEPWGRVFLSTAVIEQGRPRLLVEGTRIRLDFDADGSRLGATVDCNSMGGRATIEAGRLVVSDLATTEMGCDEARHAQDAWLADFLAGDPDLSLSGPELVLARAGTEIRLADRETADPDRPLRGTKWVVEGLQDSDTVSSGGDGPEAFLRFSETEPEGFGGNTGCNSMGGRAVVGETSITFSEVITTTIACEGSPGDTERFVLSVLDGEVDFSLDADRLILSHPSGRGLLLRAASE